MFRNPPSVRYHDGIRRGEKWDTPMRHVTSRAISPDQQDEVQPVKSAQRTVQILETLAASPERLTISQLQEIVGYPRSSLHALMRTLRDLKWVESDESGTTYRTTIEFAAH